MKRFHYVVFVLATIAATRCAKAADAVPADPNAWHHTLEWEA